MSAQQGMTLKQFAQQRYLEVVRALNEVKLNHMDTKEGREAFIVLSVELHGLRGSVPRSWWSMANKVSA